MTDRETARVEAFSDGVFAIAVTLLVLEVRLPHVARDASSRELMAALLALWPSYFAFFMSFVTILIMWINHHELFRLIERLNRRAMFANGFLLLMVTFVNFPTAVMAEHLDQAGASAAVALYCGTYVLIAIAYNCLFYSAIMNMHATARHVHPGKRSAVHRVGTAYAVGLLVYSAATVVAFFAPYVALTICSALWVLWTLLDYGVGKVLNQ